MKFSICQLPVQLSILRLCPRNLVSVQTILNGLSLIDVQQNSTTSPSFEGGGSRVIGNLCRPQNRQAALHAIFKCFYAMS